MMRALVVAFGLILTSPVNADFQVQSAAPELRRDAKGQRELAMNTRLQLTLNPATEEALLNGIPLEIAIEVRVIRHRWWWTNKVITDWTLRRRVSFHALSRQYVVSGITLFQPAESFGTLELALAHAGNFSRLDVPISSKKVIAPDERHSLEIRARLDIEALPTVLRPLAYASPSWRLNSGWTTWPLRQ